MQKLKDTFNEIHLYKNKIESFLRVFGWVVSWIGGILSIVIKSKTLYSSAYFIFSMSLLMEFAPKIEKINQKASKIIYTIFCFSIGIVLLISVINLFTSIDDNDVLNSVMFIISICVIVYMILDCIILWLFGFEKKVNTPPENLNQNQYDKEEYFYKNLTFGLLGSIEEEK